MRILTVALLFTSALLAQIPEITGTTTAPFTLRYIDVAIGTGAVAAPGKQYTVHYTGWLRDGTKFDSSRDRTKPFTFVQGRRQVIAGWETGFEGMKVGGKRRLFLPYQLAYGEAGQGKNIPPKSELIFDVELLDVSEPLLLPASDVLIPLAELESKIVALLKAVPEDKLDWRPAPGVRSFREVFLHIAYGSKLIFDIGNDQPAMEALQKRIEQQLTKDEHAHLNKEDIQKMLTENFAAVRKSMEGMRVGALSGDAKFFGTPTTRRGILTMLDVHAAEHMGQLIAYARINGITPPWSAGGN